MHDMPVEPPKLIFARYGRFTGSEHGYGFELFCTQYGPEAAGCTALVVGDDGGIAAFIFTAHAGGHKAHIFAVHFF